MWWLLYTYNIYEINMLYLSIRGVNEPILSGIGCLGLACLFWYQAQAQARARHEPEYFLVQPATPFNTISAQHLLQQDNLV